MPLLLVVCIVGCSSDRAAPNRTASRSIAPRRAEVLGEQVTRDPGSSPSTTPTSPTTLAAALVAPAVPPVAETPPVLASRPPTLTTTCADALAYLAAHQAPGFDSACAAGSALGHLGFTCVDQPGMCAGTRIIRIACPAPFVYMNEAHNSWVLIGARTGIDPYGQGSASERAACAASR